MCDFVWQLSKEVALFVSTVWFQGWSELLQACLAKRPTDLDNVFVELWWSFFTQMQRKTRNLRSRSCPAVLSPAPMSNSIALSQSISGSSSWGAESAFGAVQAGQTASPVEGVAGGSLHCNPRCKDRNEVYIKLNFWSLIRRFPAQFCKLLILAEQQFNNCANLHLNLNLKSFFQILKYVAKFREFFIRMWRSKSRNGKNRRKNKIKYIQIEILNLKFYSWTKFIFSIEKWTNWKFEIRAVQRNANLVDTSNHFEKCCKMSLLSLS